jgi:hypothetical protein
VKRIVALAICLLCNGIIQKTHASDSWIELKRAHVSFERPENWKSFKDLLGFPLVLVGPMKKGARITVGITPSDIKDYPYKKDGFKNSLKTYKDDAKKWISTKQGNINEFFPYKKTSWKNTGDVHSYGFRYNLGKVAFVERSYYLHCQEQLFHIKTLYREKLFRGEEKRISSVLDSFNCKSKVRSFQ